MTLTEAARRLREGGPPFAALTFDDGYRDTRDVALPILERHGAPATVFLAPGLIERSARLWWLELEEAIRRLDAVEVARRRCVELAGAHARAKNPPRSSASTGRCGRGRRPNCSTRSRRWRREAGVTSAALAEPEFLDLGRGASPSPRHPLIAIGAHSLTHRRLAQWPAEVAREEMAGCKAALEARLGVAGHAASPIPSATRPARAPREFALAPRGRLRDRRDDAAGHAVSRTRGPSRRRCPASR